MSYYLHYLGCSVWLHMCLFIFGYWTSFLMEQKVINNNNNIVDHINYVYLFN